MRVQPPESGRRRRILDEEKTQPGADRPQAAPGRRKARLGYLGPRGRQGAWRKRGYPYHRWRNRYAGMNPSETKRLKELEKENARLKKIVAEQAVDISILKEVSRGNF